MSLNFSHTHAQEKLRAVAREFSNRELAREFLREIDASGRAPHELLPKMAALGFTGLPVPIEYGGAGGNASDVAVLLEEIGRASVSVASLLNRALGWGTEAILRFGTDDQKRHYLSRVCTGEMIFAFSHTEPGAGSDAAAIRTHAVAESDDYVITGTKMFTTGAAECPCLIVSARTDREAPQRRGISVFLVDPAAPGVTCRRIEKLGMRGAGGLYEVEYKDVRVPSSALLGRLHGGWQVITGTLERARLAQAAYCVGAAQRAIDDAVQHADNHRQRGQTIDSNATIARVLVDLQVRVDGARLLLYRAASLVDEAVVSLREASIANLHATETLVKVTEDVMQTLGSDGYTQEFDIERTLRDARLFIIGDGSSQIQRNLIARHLGL